MTCQGLIYRGGKSRPCKYKAQADGYCHRPHEARPTIVLDEVRPTAFGGMHSIYWAAMMALGHAGRGDQEEALGNDMGAFSEAFNKSGSTDGFWPMIEKYVDAVETKPVLQ